jgi:RHS repeat-associated protein
VNDRVWASSEVPARTPGSTGASRSQVSVSSRSDRTPRVRHPIRCPHSSPAPCTGRSTRVGDARRRRTYCAGAARHYLIGRYYDPGTGQFPSVDPIVRSTGQPFQYVSDDAPNATDPTGDAEWSCIVLVTDPAFRAGPKRYGNVSIRGTQTCIGAGWGPEDIRTAIINPDTDKVLAGWNVARPTYENFVTETSEVVCKGTHRTRFLGVANGLAAGGTRNQYVESLNAHTFACTP